MDSAVRAARQAARGVGRRDPDGAWRNSPAFSDVRRYSTGWLHKRVQPDAEFKRRWVLFFDISEHYSRLATSRFTNFYLMHPTEPGNIHVQQLVRANWGDREGVGVFEQLAINAHAPTGLDGLLDGARP